MNILKLISNFFNMKEENEKSNAAVNNDNSKVAPGTSIHYDSNLIRKMEGDHKELLKIFTGLVQNVESSDFEAAKKAIIEFDDGLRSHLLLENIKLYVYLSHTQANNAEASGIINGFREEMDAIAKVVTGFIHKYKKADIANNVDLQTELKNDLEAIGGALVDRIKREEKILYPIYMPPM